MPPSPPMRHELHYGTRVLPCLAQRPATLDAMLRAAVALDRQADAVVDGAQRTSYARLDAMVDRVGAALAGHGVAPGDRVATLLRNGLPGIAVVLACARIGAVLVPMNIRQRRPETEYMLSQSGACALVHEAELLAELPAPEQVPALRLRIACGGGADGSLSFDRLLEGGAACPVTPAAEDAPACILYTSGTTGRPKGAVLTQFGIIHSCLNYEYALGLRRGDRAMLAVPASHVTGLIAIVLAAIRVGGCIVLAGDFKARRFLELAVAERVTYTLMVPAMYNLCLLDPAFAAFDLSAWRVGGFGGAPMPAATVQALARTVPGLRLVNVYGSTETTSPVTAVPLDAPAARLVTVGHVLPGCDIRVMDERGCEVPRGTAGELWIAGPMVVPGYWQNEAATAGGFAGGYWKSGDIGSMDEDGYLLVFDRIKDMINRGGFKIYSVEVEDVLSHHPAVAEAAIVGRPCPVLGERVHAFVVPRADGALDVAAVRRFCAERLADYKVPETITVDTAPLPRNRNGKLQKAELRMRALMS